MLYHIGSFLQQYFGPARLLQSYTVLIAIALYVGFLSIKFFLPKFYGILPADRGREFTLTAEASKGKPTGAGSVFITFFIILTLITAPVTKLQLCILALTFVTMLTGFFDDVSIKSWGEYKKGLLDLIISLSAAFVLYFFTAESSVDGIHFWLPFITNPVRIPGALYIAITTLMLWVSINTTNCTDGVDGLSSTLVLIALITLSCVFYFVLGHKVIATYLLVPHLAAGANWAVMTFCLSGVLMGYLWHNAYPSKVLMGDAGSRALGFYIGVCVMVTGNPFLILATSSMIFVNGGMGLVKVALIRFCHIHVLNSIRFPLHDHMRKNRGWSPTQVLVKFMIMQLLITVALIGVFLKVR